MLTRQRCFLSFSLLLLSAAIAPACDGGDGGEGGSSNTGTTTSQGGNGGDTSTTATTGNNGGNGGTAGEGGTGGNGNGGAGGVGGSATTSSGGGGNGGGSGQSVACDDLSCALPQTFCCQNYNEPAECMAPGSTCVYGVPLACDGPEDCAQGEVCCANIKTTGAANAYLSVSCATTCEGKDYRVVCGASGMCPQGDTCGVSDLLPPYLDCK